VRSSTPFKVSAARRRPTPQTSLSRRARRAHRSLTLGPPDLRAAHACALLGSSRERPPQSNAGRVHEREGARGPRAAWGRRGGGLEQSAHCHRPRTSPTACSARPLRASPFWHPRRPRQRRASRERGRVLPPFLSLGLGSARCRLRSTNAALLPRNFPTK
jgi:hypothetical protein